ncbi:DsbA family protein [Gangjinia marincola]|uniref:DsbA family protein n=1 Tax=Gangjinia marincola TaxID=578463 RepID=A0ABN1MJB6_9FLAO
MRLYYIYDALCGWCYGFSPVIQEFCKTHKDDFKAEVISGGMITGNRIGPIGEVAGYISEAYKVVEDRTGVKFGEGFLNGILAEGTAIFTSIPSAIAMSILKQEQPEAQIAFAAALQNSIYDTGIKPKDLDAYADLLASFGLDREEALIKMNQKEYREAAEADFKFAASLGVSGFPTLVLKHNDKYYAIAKGYISLTDLELNYEHFKKNVLNKS